MIQLQNLGSRDLSKLQIVLHNMKPYTHTHTPTILFHRKIKADTMWRQNTLYGIISSHRKHHHGNTHVRFYAGGRVISEHPRKYSTATRELDNLIVKV